MKKFSAWKPGYKLATLLLGVSVFVGGFIVTAEAIWPVTPYQHHSFVEPSREEKVVASWRRHNSLAEAEQRLVLEKFVENSRR